MKFVKYKLIMRADGSFITPDNAADPVKSQFRTIYGPIDISGWHIGILSESCPIMPFNRFEMSYVTIEEALEVIRLDDPEATLTEDGVLSIPNLRFDTPSED